MEMKYDAYYEEDRVYKMTYEEMLENAYTVRGTERHLRESDILAFMRYKGEDFRCTAPSAVRGTMSPLGLMVSDDDYKPVTCRLATEKDDSHYSDSSYCPLVEHDSMHDGNWYHSYKLSLTPVEFDGIIESYYVSDFCSLVNKGIINILP